MLKHILALVTAAILAALPQMSAAATPTCGGGGARNDQLRPGSATAPTNLIVDGKCNVRAGTYYYANINVVNNGELSFDDAKIDLWTSGLIIENGGAVIAGDPGNPPAVAAKPIAGPLTIHLWGKDELPTKEGNSGTPCVSDTLAAIKAGLPAPPEDHCGIPSTVWTDGEIQKVPVNGPANDYFYKYDALPYDTMGTTKGYFGMKSIGVSYGGTLALYGKKGANYAEKVLSSDSGMSWRRLQGTITPTVAGVRTFTVDRKVDWVKGDRVVVTTTDYLPGHSEEMVIETPSDDGMTFTTSPSMPGFQYRHQGVKYVLPNDLGRLELKGKPTDVETRAAVALLTRSIVIMSEGTKINEALAIDSYFGGHTVARQGFKKFQVQGVEFRQLGQGGRLGHYPVHFHMARTVPVGTFVKDTSVNESMTRWYALHATNGVLFARNVGWKSIGHGYYIEEGSEIDNKFQSNIGIWARPAIQNAIVNPRNVPGILAAPYDANKKDNVPFYSDVEQPTIFWIMNGWNDFEYNMAAGAGACGACYWLVPGANSGHSRHAKLEGYASMQQTHDPDPLQKAASTPLRSFVGNYCTTAMTSFNTVGNETTCHGIQVSDPFVKGVDNPLAPKWCDQTNPPYPGDGACMLPTPPPYQAACTSGCQLPAHAAADMYYPKVSGGGGRFPTICPSDTMDCSGNNVPRCGPGQEDRCMVTVIDGYTSSFHWNEQNFSAIWLRPLWYLFTNSVLTDVQAAGLTFVTGGGYTKSDVVQGHWALARKSLFIGHTQAPVTAANQADWASDAGPFNPKGIPATDVNCSVNHCLSANDGVSFPLSNWQMGQRMFSIYDGPAYQDSNAYLDINRTLIRDCGTNGLNGNCQTTSKTLAGRILGLPGSSTLGCYLPNAAIGWKQPNGFYYPPAFHSANLYFGNVDIRHYVVSPVFLGDTYQTDLSKAKYSYCNANDGLFNGYTDVDRQTELSDDDGSLTGYAKTVSVNVDPYFSTPVDAYECASDSTALSATVRAGGTAKTSPYDYVTTVMYPEVGFTWLPPPGVTAPTIISNSCNAGVTPEFIRMAAGQLVPGATASNPLGGCSISVNITASKAGTYVNTTSMLQTNKGNAPSVSATLTVTGGGSLAPLPTAPRRVTADAVAPTLTMTIVPSTIAVGQTALLTITIGNANPNTDVPPTLLTVPGWSVDCATPQCFGVPMYRQLLLKDETTTGPMRLAGQQTYNRSALSVNNGSFYVDTTVGDAKQRAWNPNPNVNVFQPDTNYYLFTLFAKAKTAQKYQFYVGKPFDPQKDLWATRANVKSTPVMFSPPGSMAWPPGWGRSYDSSTGVLTVTMNMGFPEFTTNYNGAFKENCKPNSFCTWSDTRADPLHPERGGTCGCTPAGKNSLFATACNELNHAGENVCAWSQKDVDCPLGGCYGIGFKTGTTFVYDPPVKARPKLACYPKDAVWNVQYVKADPPGIAGPTPVCTDAPKLPLQFAEPTDPNCK